MGFRGFGRLGVGGLGNNPMDIRAIGHYDSDKVQRKCPESSDSVGKVAPLKQTLGYTSFQ